MINLIAQTAAPAAPAGFPISMFAEMALIFGAFYFLLIAPQKKKQKEHDKLVATLQSGDEVVTTGGIFGTITNVKDDRFVVRGQVRHGWRKGRFGGRPTPFKNQIRHV
jgi:preprotein translocase subunit YajC